MCERIPTERCSSFLIRRKYNMDHDEKRANIPRLIWSDGHAEWSRWYWFKEREEHLLAGYYVGFK